MRGHIFITFAYNFGYEIQNCQFKKLNFRPFKNFLLCARVSLASQVFFSFLSIFRYSHNLKASKGLNNRHKSAVED